MTAEDADDLLEKCTELSEHGHGMTAWEDQFVRDLAQQLVNKLPPSPAQRAKLHQIVKERL